MIGEPDSKRFGVARMGLIFLIDLNVFPSSIAILEMLVLVMISVLLQI
jgi:hypothetical protein